MLFDCNFHLKCPLGGAKNIMFSKKYSKNILFTYIIYLIKLKGTLNSTLMLYYILNSKLIHNYVLTFIDL